MRWTVKQNFGEIDFNQKPILVGSSKVLNISRYDNEIFDKFSRYLTKNGISLGGQTDGHLVNYMGEWSDTKLLPPQLTLTYKKGGLILGRMKKRFIKECTYTTQTHTCTLTIWMINMIKYRLLYLSCDTHGETVSYSNDLCPIFPWKVDEAN